MTLTLTFLLLCAAAAALVFWGGKRSVDKRNRAADAAAEATRRRVQRTDQPDGDADAAEIERRYEEFQRDDDA